MTQPAVTHRRRRIAAVVLAVWSVAVAAALASTLVSLSTNELDGLTNIWQIRFALPWFIVPIPALTGWSRATMAWVDAGLGWLNGVLIAGASPTAKAGPIAARQRRRAGVILGVARVRPASISGEATGGLRSLAMTVGVAPRPGRIRIWRRSPQLGPVRLDTLSLANEGPIDQMLGVGVLAPAGAPVG